MPFRIIIRGSLIIFLLGFTLLLLLIAYLLKFETAQTKHTSEQNALWLRHQWVGEVHTEEEYRQLTNHLKENRITDAFFHVGPLNEKGLIEEEKYLYAKDLIKNLKSEYPNLHIQAWIGQVEKRGGGPLDISSQETKDNIIKTSQEFLSIGFDGIHYNIEPIYSNDQSFLDILKNTKTITSQNGKLLSVASDELEIFPGADKFIRPFAKQTGFWSKQYYKDVSENTDQIAVMMYDTALPLGAFYSNLVAWQTENILNTVSHNSTIFIGVPSYEEKRLSFHPEAENITTGIQGVQKGLENLDNKAIKKFGIAIYAEWTTDEKEWEIYQDEWLNK